MLKSALFTLCLLLAAVTVHASSFKVSDILVEGNNRVESATILAAISIRPGDQASLEDIDQAMRSIFALGRFEDISAELTEIQEAKLLTFVVSELPLVRDVLFSGNDELGEEKLQALVSVKIPQLFSYEKVKESVRAIKAAYAEDGYHAAKIDPDVEVDDRNEATLTFKIAEGEKVLIDEIRFVGNKDLEADTLKDAMQTKPRWWLSWLTGRGAYQSDIVEIDLERIKAVYYDHGYMDVKVAQPIVSLIEDNKYLELEIEINEGPQYKTGTIDVQGDLLHPKEELLKYVRLQTGKTFSRGVLRQSVEALTDLYADQGFAYVNVAPLTSKKQELLQVDLVLDIEQGTKVFIERIEIRGNTKTRDKVVRREIPIDEGDLYSASKIKAGNRNIRNLGFFEEVDVTSGPGSDASHSVMKVDLKEQPTGTFSVGAGYSSVDSLIGQGSISQDNFLGYGIKINLAGSFSGKSTTFQVGISEPHFLDTNWTLAGELYKTEREFDDYDEHNTGGSITAGHPVAKHAKAFLTYRYEQVDILNVDDDADTYIQEQEGNSTLSSITGTITRNSTDFHADPSTGGISKVNLQYAGLGGTENFVKMNVEHRHFFPFRWDTVFSVHGEVGYLVSTNSDDTPINERYFLGGIRTLRGFETREVGPKEDGSYVGGDKMAYFNVEYVFPIYKKLGVKGVVFYDTGNAWLSSESYFSSMRNSVGTGIRWQSPLGPLRFEWGYNLSPRDDERQSVFEFSIGSAF